MHYFLQYLEHSFNKKEDISNKEMVEKKIVEYIKSNNGIKPFSSLSFDDLKLTNDITRNPSVDVSNVIVQHANHMYRVNYEIDVQNKKIYSFTFIYTM